MRHRGIVSARLGILKGGASRSESNLMIAGGNHTTRKALARGSAALNSPLSRLLLELFLPKQEKRNRKILSQKFSTGAVECGKIICGKSLEKFHSTEPVEKLYFLHSLLWIIFRCGSKSKSTFPHKFPLILLLLPKLIY